MNDFVNRYVYMVMSTSIHASPQTYPLICALTIEFFSIEIVLEVKYPDMHSFCVSLVNLTPPDSLKVNTYKRTMHALGFHHSHTLSPTRSFLKTTLTNF